MTLFYYLTLCNENRFSYKLGTLAPSIFGNNVLNEQKEMKESIKGVEGRHLSFMADPDIIAKYCKQDCLLTYRLFKHFSLQLKKDGLYGISFIIRNNAFIQSMLPFRWLRPVFV